jgi:hypothetical protein
MKWEYLQVMMTTKPVKEGHSRMIVLSKGKDQAPVAAGKRMIDLLCELGAEGWELTGTLDISSMEEAKEGHDLHLTNSSLLLKRPIA